MTKYEKITVGIVVMVGLILFTFFDLQISMAIATKNMFGKIFEVIGEIPASLLALFSMSVFFATRNKACRWKNILGGIIFGVLIALFSFMSIFMTTNYVAELTGKHTGMGIVIILAVILAIIAVVLVEKVDKSKRKELRKFAAIAIFYFLMEIILTTILKGYWGRLRFREMSDPLTQFTPWYIITNQGGFDNRYASFPSGHVANSTMIIMITLLPTFLPKLIDKQVWLKTFAYLWIITVALSRVVMGAHFASDVTFGFVLSIVCFQIVVYLVNKFVDRNHKNLESIGERGNEYGANQGELKG